MAKTPTSSPRGRARARDSVAVYFDPQFLQVATAQLHRAAQGLVYDQELLGLVRDALSAAFLEYLRGG